MTTWLVEAYLPGSTDLSAVQRRARRAAAQLSRAGSPVRYVRSIFVRADETSFHLFEASSSEAVQAAAELASLVAQRIVEAEP